MSATRSRGAVSEVEPGSEIAPVGAWLELAVEADIEAVEAVSEILGRAAPGGTSVEPAFELVDEGLGARIDPTRPATVRAYLPARDREAAEQGGCRRHRGPRAPRGIRPATDRRAPHATRPRSRLGRGLEDLLPGPSGGPATGHPADLAAPPPRADDVVLALDPGMAFGTGLHPTTRLCLAGIEALSDRGVLAGARVLDVGCGSGILAIAALKLGAARAVGLDTDPIAVEATLANARRNAVSRRLRAHLGSLPSPEPASPGLPRPGAAFDVVLANLIASVLVALAPQLHDELRPGGRLLASGIFVDREVDVRNAFEAAGLRVATRTAEGEWVALEAARRA